jgi:hypothetical protein
MQNCVVAMQGTMQESAVARVMESGKWLTLQGLASITDKNMATRCRQIIEWKKDGHIFSINFQEIEYYPCFAFDPKRQYLPLPELKTILQTLKDRSDWEIALWFESPNSYLGGQRPSETLLTDSEKVLFAARVESDGINHG